MNIRDIMAKATPAVEFMYDKTTAVKRYVEYTKPSGAIGQEWQIVHEDVPCRLSSARLANTDQGAANAIEYDVKLFISASYEVLAGDIAVVDGVEYKSAKEPFVYVSHQEVLLNREGYA